MTNDEPESNRSEYIYDHYDVMATDLQAQLTTYSVVQPANNNYIVL